VGTITDNSLQSETPGNLSRNQSRQVWQALASIGVQLQMLASAQMGEGSFCALPQPAHMAPQESLPLSALVNEFLRAKARAGRSDRYLRALRNSLVKFVYGRARRQAQSITVHEVEDWITGNGWAPRTQKGYLGDVRTMFNFAVRRGYVDRNPAAGVESPVCEDAPPSIHTPSQVRHVLEFARTYDPNICRALAVRYFAGLRSSEADSIEEKEIHSATIRQPSGNDSANGFIEVTAAKSKTRRRRLVTIQPALRAWLALGGVLPVRDTSNRWRLFTAALARETGVPWPHNVTRHSFVSYHLAEFQNAGKTALEAGHSEQMLFAHYRELVTPPAAAEFWTIWPCQ
jgi:site-specific recombinase XerC